MAERFIVARPGCIGVFSFTTGFVASPPQKPKGDEEVLRQALWLARHGQEEKALKLIDDECKCSKKP